MADSVRWTVFFVVASIRAVVLSSSRGVFRDLDFLTPLQEILSHGRWHSAARNGEDKNGGPWNSEGVVPIQGTKRRQYVSSCCFVVE